MFRFFFYDARAGAKRGFGVGCRGEPECVADLGIDRTDKGNGPTQRTDGEDRGTDGEEVQHKRSDRRTAEGTRRTDERGDKTKGRTYGKTEGPADEMTDGRTELERRSVRAERRGHWTGGGGKR